MKVVKPGAAPWQWGNGLVGPTQGGQADLMRFPTPDCVQTAGAHFLLGLQGQGVTVHLWHQLGRPVDEIWGLLTKALRRKASSQVSVVQGKWFPPQPPVTLKKKVTQKVENGTMQRTKDETHFPLASRAHCPSCAQY